MTPDNETNYRTPILAGVFRGVGMIAFLSAAFILTVGLVHLIGGPGMFFMYMLPMCSALLSGLLCFAVAQIIDDLGRIAFNTNRLCEMGEVFSGGKGGKQPVGTARPTPILRTKPPAPPAVTPNEVPTGRKRFFYSVNEETLGPVNEGELQALANQGVITADTYICPEGGQEWHRLAEINEVPFPASSG